MMKIGTEATQLFPDSYRKTFQISKKSGLISVHLQDINLDVNNHKRYKWDTEVIWIDYETQL